MAQITMKNCAEFRSKWHLLDFDEIRRYCRILGIRTLSNRSRTKIPEWREFSYSHRRVLKSERKQFFSMVQKIRVKRFEERESSRMALTWQMFSSTKAFKRRAAKHSYHLNF